MASLSWPRIERAILTRSSYAAFVSSSTFHFQMHNPARKPSTAIDLDSKLPHAYKNRGYVYSVQGRIAEAERDFHRALALAPWLRSEMGANVKIIKSWKATP